MSDSNTVSVIMSVYNTNELWLRESVQSILNQSFKDFEFLIVLDCPTDDSERIICEFAEKDPRIVVLRNEKNIGLTKSLNRALMVAKGQYIARMDADDISINTRLEKQVAFLNTHQNVVAVGSRCYLPVSRKPVVNDWTEDQDVLAIRMLFANAGLPHPSAMIRKSVLDNHNIRYTESIQKSQDYKLWIDLLPYGDLVVLPDILLIYREHGGQISANSASQYEYAHRIALMQAEKLLDKLNEKERRLHITVSNTELSTSVTELDRYFQKIVLANETKGIYKQDKLERELDYLWCRKAFRRLKAEHKADMFISMRTLRILDPVFLRYIKKNKQSTKAYYQAIKAFEAAD